LQFKSADEDIDLVPVDEFYRIAPEDISKPVSGHFLQLASSILPKSVDCLK
jgi:hypothetical protein